MNVTNKYGLPASIFDVLKGKDFNLADQKDNIFWLTKLINSPKIVTLEKRHWNEMEEDVSEKVFRVLGQAMHATIQYSQDKANRLTEEKAYIDCETMTVHTLPVGAKLSDQKWYSDDKIFLSLRLDCYDGTDKVVEDYKVTSVWGVIIDGQPKPEWIAQNSIAAYVLRKIGFEVLGQRNILILRDWSKGKVGSDPKYPAIPMHVYATTALWGDKEVEEYIRERVRLHVAAMSAPDDGIKECSLEDRWGKQEVVAVMKTGRKTAVKLYPTMTEAKMHAAKEKELYVEHRPGEDTRCENYCSVKAFCHYYRGKKNGGAK